ncbi:MAG: acyl-CoA synthetase, partial [Treponema sp.]|nr:acyl-CoA synthetase [Treponema sp.]
MKFRFLFFALAAVYPFIVFIGLVVLKVPLRIFSLAVIIFGLLFFFSATGASRAGAAGTGGPLQGRMKKPYLQAVLLSALGLLCLITNIPLILRLYPVLVSAVLLGAFGSTLFFPPSFVYRLAVLMDRSIPGSLAEEGIVRYCRRVNIIWCVFFFLNSIAAALTVFLGSEAVWVLYNGGIFYGLIAIFFAVEYMVRRMVKKKLPRAVPLSRVTP